MEVHTTETVCTTNSQHSEAKGTLKKTFYRHFGEENEIENKLIKEKWFFFLSEGGRGTLLQFWGMWLREINGSDASFVHGRHHIHRLNWHRPWEGLQFKNIPAQQHVSIAPNLHQSDETKFESKQQHCLVMYIVHSWWVRIVLTSTSAIFELWNLHNMTHQMRNQVLFVSFDCGATSFCAFLEESSDQFNFKTFHCLSCRFLLGFRSTTITEMLSELFFRYASSARCSAVACAADKEFPSSSVERRWRLSTLRATSPASSLVITSQSPSLATIKHSSFSVLVIKVTSGTGIIQGLRYLSPE